MSGPCVYSVLLESVWGWMQGPSVCNVMLRCLLEGMSGPCLYSVLLKSVWGGMQGPSVCSVLLKCLEKE
jgi:hypothetical protein